MGVSKIMINLQDGIDMQTVRTSTPLVIKIC
jgi:hypothetical protein